MDFPEGTNGDDAQVKCEFWRVCPNYDVESHVCNVEDGGKYCGKWRELKGHG